eukprot:TRINITY_DN43783_c0_g1_i1.p1 TRINITY_DN43783_c0_g1~~TRINITY_DN43783_c0_g1_i1.p1  ORF type:complete len:199 (+),score=29.97 TRINITY_DN43783_c0_g1_i1:80-676(+)
MRSLPWPSCGCLLGLLAVSSSSLRGVWCQVNLPVTAIMGEQNSQPATQSGGAQPAQTGALGETVGTQPVLGTKPEAATGSKTTSAPQTAGAEVLGVWLPWYGWLAVGVGACLLLTIIVGGCESVVHYYKYHHHTRMPARGRVYDATPPNATEVQKQQAMFMSANTLHKYAPTPVEENHGPWGLKPGGVSAYMPDHHDE